MKSKLALDRRLDSKPPYPGRALRRARLKAGIAQQDLARDLGVTGGYLAEWELGRRDFPEVRLPDLPTPIRQAVAKAFIEEHTEAIRRLREVA